jgi:transposase
MPKTPPYSKEFRREAVQLLRSSGRPIPQLAKELGVSPQSLRNSASQRDVDEGKAEGLNSDELRRLCREVKVLAEEREIRRCTAPAPSLLTPGRRTPDRPLVPRVQRLQEMELKQHPLVGKGLARPPRTSWIFA